MMICQTPVRLRTLLLKMFAVLMLWCPSGLPLAGSMMEITELLSHPDYYDRQLVVVVGRVTQVQNGANRQGQPGYGFLLNDEGGSVKVVALGKAEVQEGDQVIVEGVFNRLRQTGRAVVYNEIKATAVRPISRLIPDLVG